MKKYFFIAAAAIAALASCSKVEPEDQNGPELTFASVNYMNATKASSQTDFTNTAGTIGVFAWFTPTNWATDHAGFSTTPYMNDVAITYKTSYNNVSNIWVAGEPYYWPKVGQLSFIAYYPESATATPENLTNDTAATLKFENYAVIPSYSDQADKISQDGGKNNENDLMVADFVKDQKSNAQTQNEQFNSSKGVALLFHHLLSKVIIKAGITQTEVGGIKYTISLDQFSINGIYTKATYANNTWGAASVPGNSGDFLSAPSMLETTAAQQGNEYYVMPQTIPNTATLKITYTVHVVDNEGNVLAANTYEDVEINLNKIKNSSNADITAWAKNTVYQYTLNISPVEDEIYFDVKEMTYEDVVVTGTQNYPVNN